MSSKVSALKRIITKEEHNKFNEILLRLSDQQITHQVIIGRDNDCNYRITSIEISRKHACIKFNENRWHITDLQSTNGLFINNSQLASYTPYVLINGDKISFGPPNQSDFIYQFVADYLSEISVDIPRLNIASLPIVPLVTRVQSCDSSQTVPQVVSPNDVNFNLEPNVSETISITMPTRSGANYHTNESNSTSKSRNNRSKAQSRQQPKQECVNERVIRTDHEYSRSALVISPTSDSVANNTKNVSHNKHRVNRKSSKSRETSLKLKDMEKRRLEREKKQLDKLRKDLEEKKDLERIKIKRKEDLLNAKMKELEEKEKEAQKKEKDIERKQKLLNSEKRKFMEEKSKVKVEIEESGKTSSKRKVLETYGNNSLSIKRKCNDSSEQQFEEIFDAELTCTICHELFVHAVNLNCSHTFCYVCIEQWKDANHNNKECPICREEIKNQNRQLVLDNLIERVVAKMKPEQKEHRERLVEERKKKLAKPAQSARRANINRGVILPRLHFVLRDDFNTDDSNSDSSDDIDVIDFGIAADYGISSVSNSDDSSSSVWSTTSDVSSDESSRHSNQSNSSDHNFSQVSLSDATSLLSDEEDVDEYNENEDNSSSYVSVREISDVSDIVDSSSDDSDNEHSIDSNDSVAYLSSDY